MGSRMPGIKLEAERRKLPGDRLLDAIPDGLRPIPLNRDIDEFAFPSNRLMIAEQRKLPGESRYPVVS
jgi:hypothetical protein